MTMQKTAEILSPAGNFDMLTAAVRSGADAVYLGAKDFSARRNAENFSAEQLKNAIDYCHIRGVRVYLALNILIKESELVSAFELAQDAYNMGIDGVIIEDLGLARILHKYIPDLPLHASTQMSVHSPSALSPLKELGFCQVVAAREMSKTELKALCEKASKLGITVEVFVHGALCMSVSGQCLLSAFLGSRSGNRGLCAGPCRLPFKAKNGTGYDLSLKDLSLLEYINELYDIGVRSFKIEGRMKRSEYVAAATAACKQALQNGKTEEELLKTLKNVFSRSGFTDGYYTCALGKDMFGIRTKEDVLAADKAFPKLHELYRAERQNIPVGIKAEILKNSPISLTLTDCDNNSVSVTGAIPETAKTKGLNPDETLKSLSKLGSTPYIAEGGSLNFDEGLFVPLSELNSLRRKACEMLDKKRSESNRNSKICYTPAPKAEISVKTPKIFARFENAAQIPDDKTNIDAIILPLENAEYIDSPLPLIADIPRGISSEEKTLEKLKKAKEKGFSAALCGNLAALPLAKQAGLEIIGDFGLNIANTESLNELGAFGAKAAVISCELALKEAAALNSPLKKGIIAYGNIPLMLFKNCPLKNGISCKDCDKKGVIEDRLGVQFPVRCREGFSELLNSVPIWLADKQNNLNKFDFIILYFTRETKQEAAKIIKAYKNGSAPETKHTKGLYFRGVI